ncbi:hypothetical protein F9948_24565 [Burkholderia thailandensis]|nr:hypothetical protein A8H32_23925 [Burkholderia thailandensis]MDD1483311.1 hypothetical protein [Burkholderia thailandensis]MDD1489440.1 hypothetical protein [Burkholderia thailandensis]MDD1495526.1 hypothetical protein [Burkholderia thailandensis]TGB31770.1 hypothetical protein C6946_21185 [Burkholderia thailandensis]
MGWAGRVGAARGIRGAIGRNVARRNSAHRLLRTSWPRHDAIAMKWLSSLPLLPFRRAARGDIYIFQTT